MNHAAFDLFWADYPRKEGKAAARKAWNKLKPDADLQAVIAKAVEQQRACSQWMRGFIPHASTWLNGERWADVPFVANGHAEPVADQIKRELAKRGLE